MKPILHSFKLLIVFTLFATTSKAQNTDLPNPDNNIQVMPTGSLVVAMDKTYQNAPGYFNLKAYGLIVNLQDAGVRLRWIINSGKAKDAADFSVTAERAFPSVVADNGVAKAFKAGPFVIYPTDTSLARLVINLYNNLRTSATKVNVYRTTAPVNVNVRYDLVGVKPKAAILNDGGKGSIQVQYMLNASIPATNYAVLDSAVNLYNGCYTFASEPHNDGTNEDFPIERIVDSLKEFGLKGGNFLAQCHAISAYENFNNIQSSTGVTGGGTGGSLYKTTTVLIPSANVHYDNPDLSYAQFDGTFIPNQTGFLQTWTRINNVSSTALNNFYPVIRGNTAATDSIFGATVTKHKTGKGGLVFYLGNHDFSGTTDEDINGQRMYMNAFLTPAAYGNCPLYVCTGGPECGPLPVTLSSFKAKKTIEQQVLLNWITSTELNAKEFIVERSTDGIHFVGIGKLSASGSSSIEKAYSYKDNSPAKGYNYYRLTEISTDGKIAYSEIISVYFTGAVGLNVYPSPARNSVTIEMDALPVINNQISVYDVSGKIVINKTKINTNNLKLDISHLSSGTYILKAIGSDGTVLQKKFYKIKE